MTKNKNANIENLRGLAIIFVLITHSFFLPWANPLRTKLDFGVGVDLFFVISGFLMGLTYISRVNFENFNLITTYNFYVKRISRLLPAVIFWNLVMLISYPVWINLHIYPSKTEVLNHVVSNFFFMGNLYNATSENSLGYWWSIGLEVQFYFLLPILVWITSKHFWKIITALLILSIFSELWIDYKGFWMFRIHPLFIGLIAWKVSSLKEFEYIREKINRLSNWHASLLVIFLLFGMLLLTRRLATFQLPMSFIDGCLAAICILIAISRETKLFGEVISSCLAFFGKISYSLYLCHLLVFFIMIRISNSWSLPDGTILHNVLLCSMYAIAVLSAYLSYRYIEPLMNKDKYTVKIDLSPKKSTNKKMRFPIN